ncbi:MAG TPA: hypothetical protein VK629_13985 [Steroidobacteraceae bacterium]|nr:hypothetical protein [Steroidobacteraceae bacterium]
MDEQQAMTIVNSLANGVHPVTGELFADDSPYQSPVIVRALFVAKLALESRFKGTDLGGNQGNGPGNDQGNGSRDAQAREGQSSREGQSARAPRSGASTNAGKPWNDEEDRQLLARFDASQPIAEIARAHGRTQNGVRARLEKHGRLEPSNATRWNRPQEGGGTPQNGNAQS